MAANPKLKGPTALVAASQTPPLGVLAGSPPGDQTVSYVLYNDGTVTAFLSAANTAALAQEKAVIPTANAPMFIYPVPAKSFFPVDEIPNAFWSGITASGTANVFVMPVSAQNT